jgi:hypothetical protein
MIFVLGKKVVFRDLEKEKMVNLCSFSMRKRTEIILDNHMVSFKECICLLETFKNKAITFKILPKNSDFIIGSDSNIERGKIVKIV